MVQQETVLEQASKVATSVNCFIPLLRIFSSQQDYRETPQKERKGTMPGIPSLYT